MTNNRNTTAGPDPITRTEDFALRVRINQTKLISRLKPHYDFIVCGSGSSGSVVAGRLAENPDAQVLLLEAGGTDETELITNPNRWPMTLGSELDWGFVAEPNPHLNGRAIPYSMGKVLGGGSSINVSTWSRGHRADWDFYASESGDSSWGYEAVLDLYRRRIEGRGLEAPIRITAARRRATRWRPAL
jgi:choline dehydrogenase